jgi:hypothetical protein
MITTQLGEATMMTVVIIWQLDLQLRIYSVIITTNVVSSHPARARSTRYNIM